MVQGRTLVFSTDREKQETEAMKQGSPFLPIDDHCTGGIDSLGKGGIVNLHPDQRRIVHFDVLQTGPSNGETREI